MVNHLGRPHPFLSPQSASPPQPPEHVPDIPDDDHCSPPDAHAPPSPEHSSVHQVESFEFRRFSRCSPPFWLRWSYRHLPKAPSKQLLVLPLGSLLGLHLLTSFSSSLRHIIATQSIMLIAGEMDSAIRNGSRTVRKLANNQSSKPSTLFGWRLDVRSPGLGVTARPRPHVPWIATPIPA